MSKSQRREGCRCEFVPGLDNRVLSLKRSQEEVCYGRLWAEVELPKLLLSRETVRKDNKQP